MTWPLQLALALVIFAAGGASGIKYHVGVDAQRELVAKGLRDSDARQQRKFNDTAAGQHASTVAAIATQLGDAREKIAKLSGRLCLDAGTVRVLNAIGSEPVRAAAGEPLDPPEAAATDQDVSTAISTCRAWYAQTADQLNKILDIEQRRHP